VQWCDIDGRKYQVVGGRVFRGVVNPTFDPVAPAGALHDYFRGNPEGRQPWEFLAARERINPAYRDRDARIATLDEHGLDGVWLFPTLGMLYEEALKHDPEGVALTFTAFNRWLLEDWGFGAYGKIFAGPYLSLADVDWACSELDWALDNGAHVIVMRAAAPITVTGQRSPFDPSFDPFWARVQESGVGVVFHGGGNAYMDLITMWGESAEMEAHRFEPLRQALEIWLERQGELLLALQTLRSADRFSTSLHRQRLRLGRRRAEALIGRFAALKATGVAANPLPLLDLAGGVACDSALVLQLCQLYGLPMTRSAARELLTRLSGHNALLGGAQVGIQLLLGGVRQLLLLAAPLSGGLSLAPAAPVALAQAALAVATTRRTGRLAALALLRSARSAGQPGALLRRLAQQDPHVSPWLQDWPAEGATVRRSTGRGLAPASSGLVP
jgi:uncharacterized protein (DUF697 family)